MRRKYPDKFGFIRLPDFVRAMSEKQIGQVRPAPNKGE